MIARPALLLGAAALVTGTALWTLRGDDGASASDTPRPLDGASLFQAKGCAACHAGPGTAGLTGVAPSLAATADWAGTRVDGLSAEDYVRQSILDPQAFISPGYGGGFVQMPTLPLTPEELDALVAHLLHRA